MRVFEGFEGVFEGYLIWSRGHVVLVCHYST